MSLEAPVMQQSEDEWKTHRSQIEQYYVVHKKGLRDLIVLMGEKHGFHARLAPGFNRSRRSLVLTGVQSIPLRKEVQAMGPEEINQPTRVGAGLRRSRTAPGQRTHEDSDCRPQASANGPGAAA
jgi:hypothetical protein